MKKIEVYEASDGTRFDTERECAQYEQTLGDRITRVCEALEILYEECRRHGECGNQCMLYCKDNRSPYTCSLQNDPDFYNVIANRIISGL